MTFLLSTEANNRWALALRRVQCIVLLCSLVRRGKQVHREVTGEPKVGGNFPVRRLRHTSRVLDILRVS